MIDIAANKLIKNNTSSKIMFIENIDINCIEILTPRLKESDGIYFEKDGFVNPGEIGIYGVVGTDYLFLHDYDKVYKSEDFLTGKIRCVGRVLAKHENLTTM